MQHGWWLIEEIGFDEREDAFLLARIQIRKYGDARINLIHLGPSLSKRIPNNFYVIAEEDHTQKHSKFIEF